MSLGDAGKKRRKQIESLRDRKKRLLRQGDLSMKGRKAAQEQSAQEQSAQEQQQSGEFNPNYRYYVLQLTDARVGGIPGTSLGIIERGTDNLVGKIEHGIFENYGIPDAKWDGRELKIGGKVFIIYIREYVGKTSNTISVYDRYVR